MMIAPTSFGAAAPTALADAPAPAPAVPAAPAAPVLVARPVAPVSATDSSKVSDAVSKVAEAQAAKAAVAALNKRLEPMDTSVRFELDNSTGKTVITMLDTESNSVLRQFPTEDTLAMIRALDQQQGLLINTTS
jgi:flagellar protein FlaG